MSLSVYKLVSCAVKLERLERLEAFNVENQFQKYTFLHEVKSSGECA